MINYYLTLKLEVEDCNFLMIIRKYTTMKFFFLGFCCYVQVERETMRERERDTHTMRETHNERERDLLIDGEIISVL